MINNQDEKDSKTNKLEIEIEQNLNNTKLSDFNLRDYIKNKIEKSIFSHYIYPLDIQLWKENFFILENVFKPNEFSSTYVFGRLLCKYFESLSLDLKINSCFSFLEVGCGCGALSVKIAKLKNISSVTSLDINPIAVENTIFNAKSHGLEAKINAIHSDMFNEVKKSFDFIFFNIPYISVENISNKIYHSNIEEAFFDRNYSVFRKYIKEARLHLSLNSFSKVFFGFSETVGSLSAIYKIAKEESIELNEIEKETLKLHYYKIDENKKRIKVEYLCIFSLFEVK